MMNLYFNWNKYLLVLACIVLCNATIAQIKDKPFLEYKVTLRYENQRAIDVLKLLEEQVSCTFSYNATLVPMNKMVSLNMVNKTVRQVLDSMFGGDLKYKERGHYIILNKINTDKKIIAGYVENTKGEKVAGVSLYDEITLANATTNAYGYYEMKINRAFPETLSVSKSNYADTLVPLPTAAPTLQNIIIKENQDTTWRHLVTAIKDTVGSKWSAMSDWTVEQFTKNKNVQNISDSLHRKWQVSLFPFVGTNGSLSGNVVSDYSFNVIGGYNRGVRKAELGGLFNIDREDVGRLQVAGMLNVVGGNVNGLQMAGFTNVVGGNMSGAQCAGFINFNRKKSDGLMLSGFLNVAGDSVRGGQSAGFLNINRQHFDGIQLAGFGNVNNAAATGLSIAGYFNFSRQDSKGLSCGGFANYCGADYGGMQVSGFLNFTKGTMRGVQLAGFLNVAKKVKGVQLGVFNYCDSISGLSLGVLSFVRHGYHTLELSYDDINYLHASFRTGLRKFYNIFDAAILQDYSKRNVGWSFGYGVGTSPRLSKKLYLNLDLSSHQLVEGKFIDQLNLLNKFYAGMDYQFTNKFAINAGPTLNGYLFETSDPIFKGEPNEPRPFHSGRFSDRMRFEMWVGFKVGLRFL